MRSWNAARSPGSNSAATASASSACRGRCAPRRTPSASSRAVAQLPQPAADVVDIQPADRTEQLLAQRPARHRQRRQHRPGRLAAAEPPAPPAAPPAAPAAPTPGAQHTVRRADHGRDELLGEERIPLSPCVQLVDHRRRRRRAGQPGDLLGHLVAGQRAEPNLGHTAAMPRTCVSHSATCGSSGASSDRHVTTTVSAESRRGPGQKRQAVQGRRCRPNARPRRPGRCGAAGRPRPAAPRSRRTTAHAARSPRPARLRRARPELRQQPLHLDPDVARSHGQRGLQQVAAVDPAQAHPTHPPPAAAAASPASAGIRPKRTTTPSTADPPHPLSDQPGLADPGVAHRPGAAAHPRPPLPAGGTTHAHGRQRPVDPGHPPSPPAAPPPGQWHSEPHLAIPKTAETSVRPIFAC